MPFVSRKQQKWAFSTKQPFAKRWAAMTDESKLPLYAPTSTRVFHPKHKAKLVK